MCRSINSPFEKIAINWLLCKLRRLGNRRKRQGFLKDKIDQIWGFLCKFPRNPDDLCRLLIVWFGPNHSFPIGKLSMSKWMISRHIHLGAVLARLPTSRQTLRTIGKFSVADSRSRFPVTGFWRISGKSSWLGGSLFPRDSLFWNSRFLQIFLCENSQGIPIIQNLNLPMFCLRKILEESWWF